MADAALLHVFHQFFLPRQSLRKTTPLSDDYGYASVLRELSPEKIPNLRHVVRVGGIVQVCMIAVAIDVWTEDEPLGYVEF